MRRSKKNIKELPRIIEILNRAAVGRLATIGQDGYPRVKPLNFVYHDGKLYFHGAREGEKMEDMARDNRVCFEVDVPLGYVKAGENPCTASYHFQSVIARGRTTVVEEDSEKHLVLKHLMEKYQPEGGYGAFPEEKLKITAVIRIDIEEMTGKEDL